MQLQPNKSAVVRQFAWGAVLIAVALLPVWVVMQDPNSNSAVIAAACAAGCIVLWFGWNSIRCNIITKWAGVLLAVFLSLGVCLFAFGVAVRLSVALLPILTVVLFPLLLVVLPYTVYDLLFRAPYKGRFSRVRAERRHRPSQP